MSGEVETLDRKLRSILAPEAQRRIVFKAGMTGKKGALLAVAHDLGSDRRFSGMRRKVSLNVGFDPIGVDKVELKLRPAGLWKLAQAGRRGSKRVGSTRRRGPFRTPHGFRAAFESRPSRGLHTIDSAARDGSRGAGLAADRATQAEIRRALRG
jgi:hypothetical protein